jgi:hypothetical protein
MAWIEQISTHSWRVRYRRPTGSGYATVSGFLDAKAAHQYAQDMETDRRRGTWIDPAASKTTIGTWVERWLPTLDVEIRTEENYRSCLRNHIVPRWGHIALGDITALDIATWLKQLRAVYAAATVTPSAACSPCSSTTPSPSTSSPPARLANTAGAAGVATTPRRERRRSSRCPNTCCASPSTRLNWAAARLGCWSSPPRGPAAGGVRSPDCNATTSTSAAASS